MFEVLHTTNKQTKKGTNKDVLKYTQYILLLDLDQDLPKTQNTQMICSWAPSK